MISAKSQSLFKGLNSSQDVAIEVAPCFRVPTCSLISLILVVKIVKCRLRTKHDNHRHTAFLSPDYIRVAMWQRHMARRLSSMRLIIHYSYKSTLMDISPDRHTFTR